MHDGVAFTLAYNVHAFDTHLSREINYILIESYIAMKTLVIHLIKSDCSVGTQSV